MKPNTIKRLVLGVSAGALLSVGFGSTSANAQGRFIYRYPRPIYRPFYNPFWSPWGSWNSTVTVVDPIAQQRESGYSDGHKRGKDDAKHSKANSPQSHKHYSKSDSLTYRQAFLKGYADGYREQMNKEG